MREFVIGPNDSNQRLDKYLFKLLKNAGTGLVFKQLRNKNIVLNGKKSKGNELLSEKDVVRIFMSDDTIDKFMGRVMDKPVNNVADRLNVVYEDDNIILADKPVGILSQKSGADDISMNEYILAHWEAVGHKQEQTFKPAFCNRLDRNTSGLMIGGMSLKGLQKMSEIIKDRSLQKYYLAIVAGRLLGAQTLKGYLYKDEKSNQVIVRNEEFEGSMPIHTEYRSIACKDDLTLVKVHLITGKTHQIRAHLAHLGYPILGDPKYGSVDINAKYNVRRQMLHSYEVIFPEMTGDFSGISLKSFKTEYPKAYEKYFSKDMLSD